MKILLYPFSEVYGAITWARNLLYDLGVIKSHEVSLPVISVGNITAGGTGKTPICIFIAEALKQRGFSPVVLSRGYGGSHSGPYKVSASDLSEVCGDEPLLMARRGICPVVISKKRVAGAGLIVSEKLGDIIILDDGFQHRRIKRDLDIVLIDITTPEAIDQLVSGRLLPYGRLREPRNLALKRSDVIIFNERKIAKSIQEPPKELFSFIGRDKKIFLSVYNVEKPYSLNSGQELSPCEVVAFCGIAGPEGFFQSLESLGYKIISKERFRDHYKFSFLDIEKLRIRYPHIPLVCTEKDAIRMTPEMSDRVYVLKANAKIVPEAPFLDYLLSKINLSSLLDHDSKSQNF